jgi:hypothetical protein
VEFIQRAYNHFVRKMMHSNESDPGNTESQPPSTGMLLDLPYQ